MPEAEEVLGDESAAVVVVRDERRRLGAGHLLVDQDQREVAEQAGELGVARRGARGVHDAVDGPGADHLQGVLLTFVIEAGGAEQHVVASEGGRLLDALRELREIAVADVRHDQAEDARPSAGEALCGATRGVAQFLDGREDARSDVGADPPFPAEGVGDGRGAHTGEPGDVCDRDHVFRAFPSCKALWQSALAQPNAIAR